MDSFHDSGVWARCRHRVNIRAITWAPGSDFFKPEYFNPSGPGTVFPILASLLAASTGSTLLSRTSLSISLDGIENSGTSSGGSVH